MASNTGERSEMDSDKLQDLLTVASGFQSLIYNFRHGDTYDKLAQQLVTVWEALKQTENLSKLLVSYLCLARFVNTAYMQLEWISGKYGLKDHRLQYRSGKMNHCTCSFRWCGHFETLGITLLGSQAREKLILLL